MASIFNKINNLYENPKRNTFDHSFQNNLTFNFGELVPCFCKECLPGDSFKIDPTLSLKMIPMLFPVQTRIRAHVHFFYVSNRSLWKDWQDFIGNTKENLEIPYISYNKKKIYTGSLYDYMGLPTTSYGQIQYNRLLRPYNYVVTSYSHYGQNMGEVTIRKAYNPRLSVLFPYDTSYRGELVSDISEERRNIWYHNFVNELNILNEDNQPYDMRVFDAPSSGTFMPGFIPFLNVDYEPKGYVDPNGDDQYDSGFFPLFLGPNDFIAQSNKVSIVVLSHDILGNPLTFRAPLSTVRYNGMRSYHGFRYENAVTLDGLSLIDNLSDITFDSMFMEFLVENGDPSTVINTDYLDLNFQTDSGSSLNVESQFSYIVANNTDYIDISSDDFSNNLYQQLKISALPFRAYEAIYNSFYRDERNNPLMENGEPVYNKYILNNEGGVDNFEYQIRKRNWEADFLTTAVQSPQQGVAPLVGITSYGEISFMDETSGELYTAKLNASNGDTIESFTVTSPNMPQGNLKQLVDFASSGISISDLRGVNALQRWLEINMRRGLRYKDQIMSHFGVDVRYDELLMPEFIGGFSEDVYVNQINQTTNVEGDPLGSYAGQGGSFGSSKHSITHFCQEHGYIIGIISVSPVANYSQLLPKHFLKRELLDYFFPEFGHLSMQSIPYSEVCPVEAVNNQVPLTDVFGYQRAWYDYLASTDEVHGLFRTTLRNYVVGRKFQGVPELGSEFLTINHKEIDDIFAVTSSDDSHKFLGQIFFDCKIKRPIPEYGIPKLEV